MPALPVVLGTLGKAVGLRGELRLRVSTDFWEAALESGRLVLRGPESARPVRVEAARPQGPNLWVLQLAGIEDRDAAEALVGAEIELPSGELDVAPPEALRPFQVRGLRVVHVDGTPLGEVEDLLPMPAQALLVVRRGERRHMIPAVPPILESVDLEAGLVRVDPPEGLLEL